MRTHYHILGGAVLLGLLMLAVFWPLRLWLPLLPGGPLTYYVSPAGSDRNRGTRPNAPLRSIQRAVDLARPGQRVELGPGEYMQDVISRRDGRPGAPITIAGPPGAVLRGAGATYVVEINHDQITLQGFTIDGRWGDPASATGYRDKLLYAIGTRPEDGVTGLRVLGMRFANAGGECLRLRYFAQGNEIAHSAFSGCGVYDFVFGAGGKNGEAIYIGTALAQTGDGKNPTAAIDPSNHNWVHHNSFDTRGNECVDIKEGSAGNIVEHNRCTGQRDPKSGGLDAQGDGNIFRYNRIYGNAGAAVRLGGDRSSDGVGNAVYGNSMAENAGGGVKIERWPQGQICGNQIDTERAVVGAGRTTLDPRAPCET